MTRSEFVEDVTCWSELLSFCYNEECDYCDDVYTEEGKDEYFDEDFVDVANGTQHWRDMLDYLNNIPTGYDYYIQSGDGEWSGADDYDFDRYKNDVLEWGDEYCIWDDEEEEESYYPEEEDPDIDDAELEPNECMALDELFASCASETQIIIGKENDEKKREEQMFEAFLIQE